MPIYELGYRHWEGALRSPWLRWWVISRTGVGLAFKNPWLRRLLYLCGIPVLLFAFAFMGAAGAAEKEPNVGTWAANWILGEPLVNAIEAKPTECLPVAWSLLFHYFFATMSWLLMLVVAIVGPPLIANDVRTKAFLLYFSKPITRLEYLVGKAGTVFFFLSLVVLFPALALYGMSVALAPSSRVIADTWPMILEIVGVSLILMIPATMIILCLSSLSHSSMFVTVGWLTYWTMGEFAYGLIFSRLPGTEDSKWIILLSFRKSCLVAAQSILDVVDKLKSLGTHRVLNEMIQDLKLDYSPSTALIFLGAVSLVCLAVLYRRISAPMRI